MIPLSGDLDSVVSGLFDSTLTLNGKVPKQVPTDSETGEGSGIGLAVITPGQAREEAE